MDFKKFFSIPERDDNTYLRKVADAEKLKTRPK